MRGPSADRPRAAGPREPISQATSPSVTATKRVVTAQWKRQLAPGPGVRGSPGRGSCRARPPGRLAGSVVRATPPSMSSVLQPWMSKQQSVQRPADRLGLGPMRERAGVGVVGVGPVDAAVFAVAADSRAGRPGLPR